jgi:hypothetical protein
MLQQEWCPFPSDWVASAALSGCALDDVRIAVRRVVRHVHSILGVLLIVSGLIAAVLSTTETLAAQSPASSGTSENGALVGSLTDQVECVQRCARRSQCLRSVRRQANTSLQTRLTNRMSGQPGTFCLDLYYFHLGDTRRCNANLGRQTTLRTV